MREPRGDKRFRQAEERAIRLRLLLFDDSRPKTRGDCLPGGMNEARPCPYAACKYNLAIVVGAETGSVRPTFPGAGPEDLPKRDSCVLDVADRGGETLEEVGRIMNFTRERVRQLETKALHKVKAECEEAGLDEDDFEQGFEVVEPAGAEDGAMGAYPDPGKEEPDAALRLMIHKSYNAKLRERAEAKALKEGKAIPKPPIASSDEFVPSDDDDLTDKELATARALRGKGGALVPWTETDTVWLELSNAFDPRLQKGTIEKASAIFHGRIPDDDEAPRRDG